MENAGMLWSVMNGRIIMRTTMQFLISLCGVSSDPSLLPHVSCKCIYLIIFQFGCQIYTILLIKHVIWLKNESLQFSSYVNPLFMLRLRRW